MAIREDFDRVDLQGAEGLDDRAAPEPYCDTSDRKWNQKSPVCGKPNKKKPQKLGRLD